MTHRERFTALFAGKPVDRVPVYFFGTWPETKDRWQAEGLKLSNTMGRRSVGPQLPDMDPDWEYGMWDCQGLLDYNPIGDGEPAVLEQGNDYQIRQSSYGEVTRVGTRGSSIPHTVEHALKPTRTSWDRFKRMLDPKDQRRRLADIEVTKQRLEASDRVRFFFGGSLYGRLRNYMGIEQISYLMYDDPALLEEMVEHMTEFYLAVNRPILERIDFDCAYLGEDCCGSDGPLFAPSLYEAIFDRYYRRIVSTYKKLGVDLVLLDSDGRIEPLVPYWMNSGIDAVFPIEVGKWRASPVAFRRTHGRKLRMMGGVDKHMIGGNEAALRAHLLELKPVVDEGGYLPLPDHRIPPQISYPQFRRYLRVFNEVFNGTAGNCS